VKTHLLTGVVCLALIGACSYTATGGRLPWAKAPAHGADWCDVHGMELSRDAVCNPKLVRGGTMVTRLREPREGECPNTLVRIQLGPGAAAAAGIELVTAETRPIAETIRGNGESQYVPALYARVAPRLPGVVREVLATLGQDVGAGAPLAAVDAAELADAKSAYLQALSAFDMRQKSYEQVKGLFDKRIVSGRDELESRTEMEEGRLAVQAAEFRLAGLGLTPDQVTEVAAKRDASPRLVVLSPFAGKVVQASAVTGETASPEKPLFSIASVDRLWVAIDVSEGDLTRLETGQRTVFTVDGLPGKRFVGKVVAIGGEVDDRTRTIRAFAEVKNPDGLLRAQMFGQAEITVKAAEPKLLVPREALQNDGDCNLVFVSTSGDAYQGRKVEIGVAYSGGYEVRGGLTAGEKVVTTGSFLLKTEAMKGQMGAG